MQNNDKVALFDFCETIANFQTADAFVEYTRNQYPNASTLLLRATRLIQQILYLSRLTRIIDVFFPKLSFNKRLVLLQLKGLTRSQVEDAAIKFYNDIIRPNLISPVLDELKAKQKEGYNIYIVSGGYEVYLKYFAKDYKIDSQNLISVKIKFFNEICLGVFDGGDRLWDKVECLENKNIKTPGSFIIAYSDSPTDFPFLKWADEAVVIRKKDKKSWASKYGFKELVWE